MLPPAMVITKQSIATTACAVEMGQQIEYSDSKSTHRSYTPPAMVITKQSIPFRAACALEMGTSDSPRYFLQLSPLP